MPIKSNSDMFAERGDPWELELPKAPRSPTGEIRVNRRAHVYALTHNLKPDTSVVEDPDVDRLTAGVCEPILLRLARERNTLVKPMSTGKSSSRPRMIVSTGAAKIRAKRASHLVKVK